MTTMKMNWGARIALLYSGFVVLIAILVIGSMRQSFDLVTPDYYQQEIKYQNVIDAGKNQAGLSTAVSLSANEQVVTFNFPAEFTGKTVTGEVQFYSPVKSAWDRKIALNVVNNTMQVSRAQLMRTGYNVKINWTCDGKPYYQESQINLSK